MSTPSRDEEGVAEVRARARSRPRLGLRPTRPQQAAGMRIEPPPSLPCATGTMPAATAAAEPPEEPPGVRVRVPRVARRPGVARLGGRQDPELGQVRRADDDEARPRAAAARGRRCASAGGRARNREPKFMHRPGDRHVGLDRDRHAGERPRVARRRSRPPPPARARASTSMNAFELRVERLDPAGAGLDHLARRDGAVPDTRGELAAQAVKASASMTVSTLTIPSRAQAAARDRRLRT